MNALTVCSKLARNNIWTHHKKHKGLQTCTPQTQREFGRRKPKNHIDILHFCPYHSLLVPESTQGLLFWTALDLSIMNSLTLHL